LKKRENTANLNAVEKELMMSLTHLVEISLLRVILLKEDKAV